MHGQPLKLEQSDAAHMTTVHRAVPLQDLGILITITATMREYHAYICIYTHIPLFVLNCCYGLTFPVQHCACYYKFS